MPENQHQLGETRSIEVTLHTREIDFYHVTKAEIDDIATMTIFTEIFLSLASLLAGGLLTVILTKAVYNNAPTEATAVLTTLFWVFLITLIICVAIFIIFLVLRGSKKSVILKGSKVKLPSEFLNI